MAFTQTFGASVQGASGAAITMAAPSGIADGDILIAIVNSASNGAVVSITGFTNKSNRTTTNRAGSQNILWKRASGESGNYTTNAAGGILWGFVMKISGAIASGDPFDGVALSDSTNASTTKTCSAIVPATNGDLIVGAYCQLDQTATHGSYSDTGGVIGTWTQGANSTTANTRNSTGSGVEATAGTITPQMVASTNAYTFMYAFGILAATGGGGQSITPTGLSSAEAVGSQTVANVAAQSISITGIATAQAIGTQTLANVAAQAITPSGLTSTEAVGTQTLANVAAQAVTPSGLSSTEAVGTQTLANVAAQSITVTSIAGAEAFGTLNIHGLTQYILPAGLSSDFAAGTLRIASQSQSYKLTALVFNGVSQPLTASLTSWNRSP